VKISFSRLSNSFTFVEIEDVLKKVLFVKFFKAAIHSSGCKDKAMLFCGNIFSPYFYIAKNESR